MKVDGEAVILSHDEYHDLSNNAGHYKLSQEVIQNLMDLICDTCPLTRYWKRENKSNN